MSDDDFLARALGFWQKLANGARAQLEEELRRPARGLPPRDADARWLHETPR